MAFWHLRQILPKDRARVVLVLGLAQEIHASDVPADIGFDQLWIAGRPFTPRRAGQALVINIVASCFLSLSASQRASTPPAFSIL